ncbi:metallophosphoesterase [Erysipelothrix tonsillarum]|uniref:metallophosphoesterase n=1 Tax=Erysipelothrix tonsillarum TaxID=38402 RepID=UPI0003815810|nr:metallophosphoesterase [Erysipelothrix tonsillarum]
MKEIIVCSDNHGKAKVLKDILQAYPNADAYIHCGDNELDYDAMKPFHAVTGNNDYYYQYPEYLVVELGDTRIFVAHGHLMRYRKIEEDIIALAKEHRCNIACYGHTHVPVVKDVDGILLVNPGSLYYNRDGSPTCFAKITISDDKVTVEELFERDL